MHIKTQGRVFIELYAICHKPPSL